MPGLRRPRLGQGSKPQEPSSIVNHETLDGKIAGTARQGAAASRIPSLAAPALPPRRQSEAPSNRHARHWPRQSL